MDICWRLVWHSCNGVGHIDTVKIRRARLVLGLVTASGGIQSQYFSGHSRLAIPPWVGAMSTGGGFGHQPPLGKKRRVLRRGEPCCQNCWHTGLLYASLIGSDPHWLEGQSGLASSQKTLHRSTFMCMVYAYA